MESQENTCLDETIIALKNKAKEQESKDIYGKVSIKNQPLLFEDSTLFNNKMKMRLPKDFVDMPEGMAKLKYPSENRPQLIKSNADGSVNITLSLLEQSVTPEQVGLCLEQLKGVIKKVNPANIFYQEDNKILETTTIGYFDFKSYAIDAPLYNLVFIAAIENKLMMGIFNAPFDDYEDWDSIALQMACSIKDLTNNLNTKGGSRHA